MVWDVDLLSPDVVRVYRAADPAHPTIYRRGEVADAEPAVPGWTLPVDRLFRALAQPVSLLIPAAILSAPYQPLG